MKSKKSLPTEKLQKVLARLGLASRREAERWIADGRLKINGKKAQLGDRVSKADKIHLDGRFIKMPKENTFKPVILAYHKPEGEICSRKDPEGRRTVFHSLPKPPQGRWIAIGRLDYNTSGLMLFTNDGELANVLMHPSSGIDREYMVRVMGRIDDAMLTRLTEGVLLEDGMARFTDIVEASEESDAINKWFYVCVMEGRNREVRRLWESQDVTVSRLKRVRFGPIFIPPKLRKGQYQELTEKEVTDLMAAAGNDKNK